ncbi:ubiquinol-cytochrome-c reductase complex assembly factor 1 [Scaptodrosophila lebanonensis]|uniref:Ubiquinol-cytochrome-c reductase complex assembly factor 1 n=1 Tax=Drosophila lebanonensis TaxID=7225 RepID=A0A6J2T8Y1_DROLE|nr:ubiquinol-cytochrome-c reductase complex assembly factor 1 [Scaptodrosophila lebanonensis]
MLCTRTVRRLASGIYIRPALTLHIYKPSAVTAIGFTPHCRLCSSGPTATGVVTSSDKTKQSDVGDTNILKRVLTKVGFTPNTKARLKIASHLLYESVADKINYVAFFNDFNLPNTFNSWFLVTELHVWLLLMRSMAEGSETGEDGRFLRNCIVEAMWGDVNTRAKKLGANNPSRTRQQIQTLSEQFQAALIAYDEGIMSDDKVLACALWRRFFELNCDDYTHIERLVKYVRQQAVMLDSLSREQFITKPKIPWLDLDKCRV